MKPSLFILCTLAASLFYLIPKMSKGLVPSENSTGQPIKGLFHSDSKITTITGDFLCRQNTQLILEIGGTIPGKEYDQLLVKGHLDLNGSVELLFIDDFTPSIGMSFKPLNAHSISGAITSLKLPQLPEGLFWHDNKLTSNGELRVENIPETYEEFATFYGITSAPTDDADGDGRSNILEYVTAGNPTSASSTGAKPRLEIKDGLDYFTFTLPNFVTQNFTWHLATTNDQRYFEAGGWDPTANQTEVFIDSYTVEAIPLGGDITQYTIISPTDDHGKLFSLTIRPNSN